MFAELISGSVLASRRLRRFLSKNCSLMWSSLSHDTCSHCPRPQPPTAHSQERRQGPVLPPRTVCPPAGAAQKAPAVIEASLFDLPPHPSNPSLLINSAPAPSIDYKTARLHALHDSLASSSSITSSSISPRACQPAHVRTRKVSL